jgi:hypothetical protein
LLRNLCQCRDYLCRRDELTRVPLGMLSDVHEEAKDGGGQLRSAHGARLEQRVMRRRTQNIQRAVDRLLGLLQQRRGVVGPNPSVLLPAQLY